MPENVVRLVIEAESIMTMDSVGHGSIVADVEVVTI